MTLAHSALLLSKRFFGKNLHFCWPHLSSIERIAGYNRI
jgi:hypothetical protein